MHAIITCYMLLLYIIPVAMIYVQRYVFTVGIALIRVMGSNNSVVSANAVPDYSYVNDRSDNNVQLTRCVTGLGPSGTADNSALGGVYFNGDRIPDVECGDSPSPIVRLQIAQINNWVGVMQTVQCREFSTAVEGIYTCIMMNSSMMSESIRFGVYFTGRSESLIYTSITLPSFISLHSSSSDRYSIIIYCNSSCWFFLQFKLYLTRFSSRHIHLEEG